MIRVSVPATTANLGSGFDTFGLALTLYNEFFVEECDSIIIDTEDEYLRVPENNLFISVFKKFYEEYGNRFKGVKLKQINNVPVARGLGSSATAIVAAIVAASKILNVRLDDDTFFKVAYQFEPHPDNLLPAWKGNFIVAAVENGKTYYQKIDFPEDLKAVVVIPEIKLSTEKARKVLPEKIPLKDAIFNVQRASLFVSSIVNRNYKLLKVAMDDKIHQPYRKSLIPEFDSLIEASYEKGSLGTAISGAGTSVVSLTDRNFNEIGETMVKILEKKGIESEYKVLDIDKKGAIVKEV